MSFQIVRYAVELWEVFCVDELWHGTTEYEVIGRVIRDGDLYYVEFPEWNSKGKEWKRQPRGYQLPKGAFRAITESNKPSVEKIKS